jgi:hypothetical protein
MGKRLVLTLTALVFVITTAGIACAGGEGNARKGKYTYRKVYKACFQRGEVSSPKPLLSPDTKTQAQWKRTFENKDFNQFKCSAEWSKLSDNDLTDIYAYLHDHAADSPSPAKCK